MLREENEILTQDNSIFEGYSGGINVFTSLPESACKICMSIQSPVLLLDVNFVYASAVFLKNALGF